MKSMQWLAIAVLAFAVALLPLQGKVAHATPVMEVSQPTQVTSDTHYERGNSVLKDSGGNYWLFYGRSEDFTGNYGTGNPDNHHYVIYYNKAGTIAGLASATPQPVGQMPTTTDKIYQGQTSSVEYDGKIWVFGVDMGDGGGQVKAWTTSDGGSNWGVADVLPSGTDPFEGTHLWATVFDSKIFLAVNRGGHIDLTTYTTAGGWTAETEIVDHEGMPRFYEDSGTLYFYYTSWSLPAYYIYEYSAGPAWTLVATITGTLDLDCDPILTKVGGEYVFIFAPWDGTKQFLKQWTSSTIAGFDGKDQADARMVTRGGYGGTTSWVDMWPATLTDGSDVYMFYGSEANGTTSGTGNIFMLGVDWSLDNDHYLYIQNAIDEATSTTINVAPGTYDETLRLDGTKASSISVIGEDKTTTFITGGVRFESSYAGLAVENFTITGDGRQRPGLAEATVGASSSASVVSDARFSNNILDGEGITGIGGGRFGVYLSSISGSFTFENNEVKNYPGWGTLELNQSSHTVTSYVFTDNDIHDNSGSSALRGNAADRADTVIVTGNDLDNNGGGDSWASIEVNEAETVTISGNSITNTQAGNWGEGQALQVWHITSLTVTDNVIEDNYEGIYFPGDAWASDLSGVEIHHNSIAGNTQFGLKAEPGNTGTGDATENWWGHATGPDHSSNPHGTGQGGDVVSDGFTLTPWYATSTTTPSTEYVSVQHNPVIAYSDTIQGGIDAALSGDTVSVADGTYTATSLASVVITKDGLSLVGQSRDGTIIDGGTWGTSNAGWPKGIHIYANDVTVSNLTVRGFTGDTVTTGGYGILFRDYAHDMPDEGYIFYSGGRVENVKVENNYSPMYALVHRNLTVQDSLIQNNLADGMFIARESDNATITGNTVLSSGDHGIWIGYDWMALGPSDNAVITGNVVDGAREGGISFVASDTALISENDISHVKGEEPEGAGGWSRGAISLKDGVSNVTVSGNVVHDNDGLGTGSGRGIGVDGTSSNITITGNIIRDNAGGGIKVMGTTTGWTANFNSIHANTSYGAENTTGAILDFTGNWWGSDTGPSHALNPGGTGDAAGDNVAYSPWLGIGADASGDPGFQPASPMTYIVAEDVCLPVGCIQQAVDLASAGDTLDVKAGTYNEQVVIDKSLVVDGAGQGVTVVAPSPVTANTTRPGGGSVASAAGTPVRQAGPLVAALAVTADAASAGMASAASGSAGIIVVDGTTDVTIQDLTVDGAGNGITSCSTALFGVYWRNASGTLEGSEVRNIELGAGLEGCQGAVGILAESGDGGSTIVTIDGNYVHDVQKNGIVARGSATTAGISGNTVVGWGPTDKIAQNGIQLSFGAAGSITGNEASLHDYTPSTWAATGILVHYAADGVTVSGNQVHDNMEGIFVVNYSTPTMKNVEMSGNTVTDTRDTGVFFLLADDATVSGTTISGGAYGLWIADSNGASVHDSTIEDNDHGIIIDGSSTNASIYVNDILSNSGSSASGIHVECYGACPSDIEVHFNNIVGNSPVPGAYGVYNDTTNVVNATHNWWGACDGPSGEGPGGGDAVSTFVDYDPWLSGACDYDGDGLTDDAERLIHGTDWQNPDTDGDGCSDGEEVLLPDPALGGLRDPLDPWDFYDVPVPTLGSGGTMNDRDSAVNLLGDILAVLEYAGTSLGGPPNGTPRDYDDDIDGDTAPDGIAYDRSVGPMYAPGPPARFLSAAPDGAIALLTDVLLVLDQTPHSCQAAP